jgi:DNA-binding Xre family transcriptional regulator
VEDREAIQATDMTKEDLDYFITGLGVIIDERGIVQTDLATRAGISAVNLSRVINRRAGCSAKWRRKVCAALGVFEEDVIREGSRKRTPTPPPPPSIPGVEAGYVSPFDVVSAVNVLAGQYTKANERMHCWMAVFELLPVAALIVRDDIVVHQNHMSRIWGNVTGRPICEGCISSDGCERATCPVTVAVETNDHASGYRMIGAQRYRVDATPMRHQEESRLIVTATEAPYEDQDGEDRRHGVEDRRSTTTPAEEA